MATVTVERAVACARCAAGKGCGAGLLSGKSKSAQFVVPVPESMHLRTGDRVSLELSPENLLRASFLVYGLPLFGAVIALMLGWIFVGTLSDPTAIVLAIVGLGAGWLAGRARIGRDRCLAQFIPRIATRSPTS